MSKTTYPPGAHVPDRHDRLLQEREHDPYHAKLKLEESTVCQKCNAVFRHGRWQWGEVEVTAALATCPACQRMQDKMPAGFLIAKGNYVMEHQNEILNLIHNVEHREKASHPLKRIMEVQPQEDGMVITCTDPGLARAIGVALNDAYQGELEMDYPREEFMVRATWTR